MLIIGHEAEIGRVLVPSGKRRAVRLLDEPGRGIDQDVGSDQAFDRVEDAGMTNQRVDPGQEDITRRAPAEIALIDRPAQPMLEPGEPVVAFGQLRGRQRREWEQVTVTPISLDLAFRQHFVLPIGQAERLILPRPDRKRH